MSLNVLEYVSLIAAKQEQFFKPGEFQLHVPICFAAIDQEITRLTYRLLLNNPDQVRSIWKSRNVEESKMLENWDKWMQMCSFWTQQVYGWEWRVHWSIPHRNLLKEIIRI